MDHLPTLKAMMSCLYHSRAKRLPLTPRRRAEVGLMGEWMRTLDGRDFVLANDGVDETYNLWTAKFAAAMPC